MPTTHAPPSSRGRDKDDWDSSMFDNEQSDSYVSPLETGDRIRRTRNRLLTGRRVPTKTESVSESVDRITGDCLRLQLFLCRPKIKRLPRENRAQTRSRIAKRFWR